MTILLATATLTSQSPPLGWAVFAFIAVAIAAGWLASRIAWTAPAIVVATAPFAWYHQFGPTEITVSKAAFVGVVLGVGFALARDPGRRARALSALRSNQASLPFAALVVWSGLSALWAGSPDEAIRDALKLLWYAGVLALTIVSIEETADGLKVFFAMFVTAAAVGVAGAWQHLTSAPAGFVAPGGEVFGRIAGTLEGPNQFGAYLESVIPPLLALLLFGRIPRLAVVAGALLLGLLVADLFLTFSRGALWACTAAVFFVVIIYARQRLARADEPAPLAVFATIAACVVLVAMPVAFLSIGAPGWEHELWTPTSRDSTDSTARRGQLWTCAVEVFERHPLAGVGAGNFADAKQECGPALAGTEHFSANQWYLETAADLGIVGLVLLAAFLFGLLRLWRTKAPWQNPVALGSYAVLIAFVLHGFVDDLMTYPKAVLSFFVLMGLLGVHTPSERRPM